MRLSKYEQNAIKQAAMMIDKTAKVYLFGSRVYDDKRGGDIDLLIFSNKMGLSNVLKFQAKLWDTLDEQKIDVVIPDADNKAFVNMILEEAVLL